MCVRGKLECRFLLQQTGKARVNQRKLQVRKLPLWFCLCEE